MQKKWKRIDKTRSLKPTQGTYQDWKPQLAEEAEGRCVYCAIFDAELGGQRNFHVEHYKPKSLPEFVSLKNDYDNLFYACPICNTFKSNSWFPIKENDWDSSQYPNPALYNYGDFFEITTDVFTITGNNVVGEFLIQRLHLNRFQLIYFRRYETSYDKLKEVADSIEPIVKQLEFLVENNIENAFKYYREIFEVFREINRLNQEKAKLSLYAPDELRQSPK